MITFTKGDGRGQWQGIKKGDGTRGAIFKCPDCGHERLIVKHEISDDGTVTPSVVCSCSCGCGFHEHVKLEGWEDE